jgi:hypothetical protein
MASGTMQRLISSINGGGFYGGVAHTNKFVVHVHFPFGATGAEIEGLALRCESVSMPGRNVNTSPNRERYGPATEIADGLTFEDVTCTFLADEKFAVKDIFSEWQYKMFGSGDPINSSNNPTPTFNMGFYDDYVGAVDIFTLNQNGEKKHGIRLVEAFPKTINANEFSMATANELQKVSVSFEYRYWHEVMGRFKKADSDTINPERIQSPRPAPNTDLADI